MDHNYPLSQRPKKKRRTVKGGLPLLRTGDDATADGSIMIPVMMQTAQGPVEGFERRRVWLKDLKAAGESPTQASESPAQAGHPSCTDTHANHNDIGADLGEDIPAPRNLRSQRDYLRQFVDRVDPMLDALLSRESAGRDKDCPGCGSANDARWRCRDCTAPKLLCRGCMRVTHWDNPLHRIELWTGKYFRAAALWEVGVYFLVPHHMGVKLCDMLVQQVDILERYQKDNDDRESEIIQQQHEAPAASFPEPFPSGNSYQADLDGDVRFMQNLDEMYQAEAHVSDDAQNMLEEEDEIELDDEDLTVPAGYLPADANRGRTSPTNNTETHDDEPQAIPRRNALAHPFVRIVHTNGMHHIALVTCDCRGGEGTHGDLMAARLMPTSFVRYKTMFTHHVLDEFRLANLECKASAYQYFQMLRRHTAAMSPDSVPNLYHELRRMSRQWRWMKKLKWAGFGHQPQDHTQVIPGSLANFCPACPQPGINLPEDWEHDPRTWVYQRSFVADGNFKADHVRQKNTENDVWLSEGGGMSSKRDKYQEFLKSAIDRVTVST
jgi:hypothetical protein